MVPPGLTEQDFGALLPRLDGLLFTGGGDVHPKHYGGKNHPLVDGVDQERDELELSLAQALVFQKIPFLGICRGLQVINVALGGTIYEDILSIHPTYKDLTKTLGIAYQKLISKNLQPRKAGVN